jgi:hypothetical protein
MAAVVAIFLHKIVTYMWVLEMDLAMMFSGV